jgi:hypothetical protein
MVKQLNSSNKVQAFSKRLFPGWHFLLALIVFSSKSYGQVSQQLTPEIQAYLFHIVRKSPILDQNIGKAFEYSGPMIFMENGSINYDSIDRIITVNPNLLTIRSSELSRCPKGIITEACNKTAIYEMCQQIHRYADGAPISTLPLLEEYFLKLFKQLPQEFNRGKLFDFLIDPNESPLLLTNISFAERLLTLQIKGYLKTADCKLILEAQGKALNASISERTHTLFNLMGGESNVFISELMAAGDGSYTEGMLQERDKDEYGEWNQGLPRAIGLFPYELTLSTDKKPNIKTERITQRSLLSAGDYKETQLHFDVWGYNSTNQTTVIIEKGGRQYPLFGSQTTRFLTPDSTFSKGTTFMHVLNNLYSETYESLKKQLDGKDGLNQQVKDRYIELGEIEAFINQKEGDLGELYKEPYKTRNITTKDERKRKKSDDPTLVMKPTTKARKKAKSKKQWDLIELYASYDETSSMLEQLIKERNELSEEFEHHDAIYRRYKKLLGEDWVPFTVKEGLYLFEDGTTFDIYTQDLTFKPTSHQETIEVRLISIPDDYEGETSDEIMMHISMVDARPYYDADFEVNFEDVFKSDAYLFDGRIFTEKDTAFFREFFEGFDNNNLPIELNLEGMGIGRWKDSMIIRDLEQQELKGYPGNTVEEKQASRESWAYKSLRHSALQVKINRSLQIHIESTTDPVVSNLTSTQFPIESILKTNNISKNELLSVLRTRSILMQTKNELIAICPKYLSTPKAKKFIDQLEERVAQSKFYVGETAIKLPKARE